MICINCGRNIEDNSLFCNWCGEKQIVERKRKQATYVPVPRQLASGKWFVQLRMGGQSITVSETSKARCISKARAIKDGFVEVQARNSVVTVGSAIDSFLADNENVLSPSTLKAYHSIRKHRFQTLMDKDIHSNVNWQAYVNREAALVSPKTLSNCWRLIAASLRFQDVAVPNVRLPMVPKAQRPWLDYEEIKAFLDAVHGQPCEIGALLALHGLRRSELMALTIDDIDLKAGTIAVNGAVVYDTYGELVSKTTNKNRSSQRVVPIVIPRLTELLKGVNGRLVTTRPNTLYAQVNRVCERNGLPLVGVHGLRHSFASLAYHLGWSEATTMAVGGWANSKTVHDIYTHLSVLDKNADVRKMEAFYSEL